MMPVWVDGTQWFWVPSKVRQVGTLTIYQSGAKADSLAFDHQDGAILLHKQSDPWKVTPIFMGMAREHNMRLGHEPGVFPEPGRP